MDNYKKESKEIKDIFDLIDLSRDIYNGVELINKRKIIPMYSYNQFGFLEISEDFIQNENDIVKYVNNINQKYNNYINMAKLFQPNIQWNILENCVDLLQKIQTAQILGKAMEEISNQKEN